MEEIHTLLWRRGRKGEPAGKIILRSCFNLTLCAIKTWQERQLERSNENTAVIQPSPLPRGSPRTSPHSEPRALLHSVLQYPCSGPVFCSLACPFFTPGFCSDCRARPPASSPCCPSARRSGFLWLQPAAQVTSRTLSLLQLPLFADASLGNVVLGTGAMVSWVLTPLSSGLIVSKKDMSSADPESTGSSSVSQAARRACVSSRDAQALWTRDHIFSRMEYVTTNSLVVWPVGSLRTSTTFCGASQVAQWVENLPAMQEMQEIWARFLGQEDLLEEGKATHSSILAWRVPRTEEPGGLRFTGWQRVGHD